MKSSTVKAEAPLVAGICDHCGQAIPPSGSPTRFCCHGCEAVYRLLHENGLDKFYDLKPKRILPQINYFQRKRDLSWVEQEPGFAQGQLSLDVEGVQCAACVWAIKELGRRRGMAQMQIDPTLGILQFQFDPQNHQVSDYLEDLQNLGYRTSTPQKKAPVTDRGLLIRLGVCVAVAMNTMFLSISMYLGLDSSESMLFELFIKLNFYLSFISVAVGGSYFFNRALQALKRRVLHFDLPIAVGILAAFLGSLYAYQTQDSGGMYFDTLNIFIALMLAGRYLQNRFLLKNRNYLLSERGLGELKLNRLNPALEEISFSQVKAEDRLLIQPGGIVPVGGILLGQEAADFNTAWISGEGEPVTLRPGEQIPAGALLISLNSVQVRANSDFGSSLLAKVVPPQEDTGNLPMVWQWVSRWYVILVLSLSVLGLVLWAPVDFHRALIVFISVLVVTCPCSLGIAIPLARSFANKAMLQRGIFARNPALLDELQAVRDIFLDKTGTLTLAQLQVENPQDLLSLDPEARNILFNMALRSRHPASQAIYQFLSGQGEVFQELEVREVPGEGLHCVNGQKKYFLGKSRRWEGEVSGYESSFYRDGNPLLNIRLQETLLAETAQTLERLRREGYRLALLSGDKAARVKQLGEALGFSNQDTFFECSPEAKAQIIRDQGKKVLMIGDGLNDALAFQAAKLSGAPVSERSVMPGQGDFFFVSSRLDWLDQLLKLARRLRNIIKMNLIFAFGYNVGAVSLALAGLMNPLWCALLMPSGSLLIIGLTSFWMSSELKT